MNNLKRVLSLGLTGTMLTGMMVMGASAAKFNDADKITHTEAVNTMVALNVLNGKDTGNYDPQGIVTRAEMAKIICVMLNGGAAPTLGTKTQPTYSDIKGHWAESYIEYCSSIGVIAGQGDGTFAPDATVTGSAAAKMMLVALGYDTKVFGFTGMDWEINTNVSANNAKLYDGLKGMNASAGLTRDNVAQMAYNATQAYVMTKSYDSVASTGEVTYKYALSTTTTFLNDKFDAQLFVGTMVGNYETGATGSKEDYIKVKGQVTTSNAADVDATFASDLDISNIGEEVKVIFADGNGGTADRPDSKDTIYGVYNTGATTVYKVTKDDLQDAGTTNLNNGKIKFGDETYEVAAFAADEDVVITNNYGAKAAITAGTIGAGTGATAKEVATYINTNLRVQSGDTIKMVTNSDGKIAALYVVESVLGTVTAKNSEKVTINNNVGTLKIADNEIYDGIAKNDVVVATTYYAGDKAIVHVEKAEKISGEVKGYTPNDDNTSSKVVLDGTSYEVANKAAMPSSVGGETAQTKFATTDINENFDLYLLNGKVAGAVKTTESASNYSLVLETNAAAGVSTTSNMNPLKATFMAADGTKTTLEISDKSSTAGKALKAGDIVTYTLVDGEAKVSMAAAYVEDGDHTAPATALYNKTNKTFKDVVTSADCVLFTTKDSTTLAGASFKAQNIRDLKDITADGKFYSFVKNDDGKVVAAFINVGASLSVSTADTMFGIVTATKGIVEIDDVYYNQYKVWAGEELTVNIDTTATGHATLTVGNIYGFVASTDSQYNDNTGFKSMSKVDLAKTDVAALDGFTGAKASADVVAVKSYDESEQLLTYYTTQTGADPYVVDTTSVVTKAVADDVKIIYVNVDDDAAGDDIGVNSYDAVNNYMNAIILLNDDGVISHIIVETSGEGNIYG